MTELRKLKEAKGLEGDQLLTVRARQSWLSRDKGGTLYVKLDWDDEIHTSSGERRQHFESVDQEWFHSALEEWNKGAAITQIATLEHPLEVATGDACLVLDFVTDRKQYVVSFYRDIMPMGWVTPGGCPSDFKELFHPKRVAAREACEELFLVHKGGLVYVPKYSDLKQPLKVVLNNADAWGVDASMISEFDVEEFEFARGVNADARNIVFQIDDYEVRTENTVVTIDPDLGSVSVVLYSKIKLDVSLSEIRLFDGEALPDGTLLNRPVRLTPVGSDEAAAVFSNGQDVLGEDWIGELGSKWITEAKRKQVAID